MRRTVEGIMLVHEHGHPHVLLIQVGSAFFKLPGDYLKPHESDEEGLKARMHLRLGPDSAGEAGDSVMKSEEDGGGAHEWEVSDVIGQFWRPNFESFMVRPLLPPSKTSCSPSPSLAGLSAPSRASYRALARSPDAQYRPAVPVQASVRRIDHPPLPLFRS